MCACVCVCVGRRGLLSWDVRVCVGSAVQSLAHVCVYIHTYTHTTLPSTYAQPLLTSLALALAAGGGARDVLTRPGGDGRRGRRGEGCSGRILASSGCCALLAGRWALRASLLPPVGMRFEFKNFEGSVGSISRVGWATGLCPQTDRSRHQCNRTPLELEAAEARRRGRVGWGRQAGKQAFPRVVCRALCVRPARNGSIRAFLSETHTPKSRGPRRLALVLLSFFSLCLLLHAPCLISCLYMIDFGTSAPGIGGSAPPSLLSCLGDVRTGAASKAPRRGPRFPSCDRSTTPPPSLRPPVVSFHGHVIQTVVGPCPLRPSQHPIARCFFSPLLSLSNPTKP